MTEAVTDGAATATVYRHADLARVTREAVLEAVGECDREGMHAFLEKHGYLPSRRYQLRYRGKSYPSKAVLGVAAGLSSREFFGGAAVVVRHLTRLGFKVRCGRRRVTALGLLSLARRAQREGRAPWTIPELAVEPAAYFASGSNNPAEIRGFASVGQDVGVAAQHLHEPALRELEALAGTDVQVFIDSGAFSEFTKGAAITPAAWEKRLATYLRLGRVLGSSLWVVAPDKVADQAETLARLARYRPALAEIAATGARVLAPIQKGSMDQAAFARAVGLVLEDIPWLPAMPCKEAATTAEELGAFLRARPKTPHVHLLGLGPARPRRGAVDGTSDYLAHVARAGCSVSLDSMWICANVGRGDEHRATGQLALFGGSPIDRRRLYTWAQDVAWALLAGKSSGDARELALMLSFGLASVLATDATEDE